MSWQRLLRMVNFISKFNVKKLSFKEVSVDAKKTTTIGKNSTFMNWQEPPNPSWLYLKSQNWRNRVFKLTQREPDEVPSKFKSQIIGKLFKCSHESIKIVLLEIYFVSEFKISFLFQKPFGKQKKRNSIWKAYVMNF